MANGRVSNRGQVLIIFVFAIIGLIAITGLAVDGVNIFSDRRNAQNAADTAAMAAALEKVKDQKAGQVNCTDLVTPSPCGSDVELAAMQVAQDNHYVSDITDATVEVHIPPIDGPYSDCTQTAFNCLDYVQVIISDNVNTWFARVLGVNQLHNRVEAVALAKYSPQAQLYGGMSLVELGQDKGSCPSDFDLGGSGTVNLNGGGIYVNSSNASCAYKQTSCSTIILQGSPAATINVVGGADIGNCVSPPITKATTIYPWPPAELISPPSQCSTAGTFGPGSVSGSTQYQPGNYYAYNSFPVNNDNAVLAPGVYCINNLNNLQNNNQSLTGSGVFFYMRPTGQVQITGGANVNITAPTGGTYQDMLIYQDWDQNSKLVNCQIEGTTASKYTGLIYVPYCDPMKITGTSSSNGFDAQIIAYTITIAGTTELDFTYDANSGPVIPEQDLTGLYH